MLKMEDYIVIKRLKDKGVYLKGIAEELGVHPKTVTRGCSGRSPPEPYPPTSSQILSYFVFLTISERRPLDFLFAKKWTF